jgi:hypothetical protein
MNTYQKALRLVLSIAAFSLITHLSPPSSCQEMPPEDKLQTAEELSTRAAEMAAKTKETGNLALLESALERVNKASLLVLEVVAASQEKADPKLAQATMNVAAAIHDTIARIIVACEFIASTSTDPNVIADAEGIIKKANEAEVLNAKTKQMVLASLEKPEKEKPEAQPEAAPLRVPPPDTETTEIEVYQREASPSQ